MLEAARLAASNIAVRASVDLLFVVTVEVVDEDDDDIREETGVVGADIEEGIIVGSFDTSLSDRLLRLRVKFDCKIAERSDNNSLECSESDRERNCLSVLIVNGFREDDRSSASFNTDDGSDKDDNK